MILLNCYQQASGLAEGKGVLLPSNTAEAVEAARSVLLDKVFGAAGKEIVVEQFLEGEEVSILAFCDGVTAVGMPAAQVCGVFRLGACWDEYWNIDVLFVL